MTEDDKKELSEFILKNSEKDAWISKAVIWILCTGFTILLTLTGGFLSHISGSMQKANEDSKAERQRLSSEVNNIRTDVAVIKQRLENGDKLLQEVKDLKAQLQRIRDEQIKRTSNVYLIDRLVEDIKELKERLKRLEK